MGLLKSLFSVLSSKPTKRSNAPTPAQKREYDRLVRVNQQLDRLNMALDQERLRLDASVDELGEAANAGQQAMLAVREKRFDEAWSLFHKQKHHLLSHAHKCNFTKAQTLAIDASVHEHLANILRIEKRHTEALAHILYSFCAGRSNKSLEKKVVAYFNRAALQSVGILDLQNFIKVIKKNPEFRTIQNKIQEWRGQN